MNDNVCVTPYEVNITKAEYRNRNKKCLAFFCTLQILDVRLRGENMGVIIIFIMAVIEVAFAIYSIKTKSDQKRNRSWMRIGVFVAFIILTLASVIQWSFRWKLLALVLLVWAITGVLTLIRNKEAKQEYRTARVLIKAISMWLIT